MSRRPMIDAHVHVCPPNLPGTGSLSPLLTRSPDVIARALQAEMKASGLTAALGMGEWNADPSDPLGVGRTLRVAELVPGLHAIGVADPHRGDDPDHIKRAEIALKSGRVAALKCYLGYLHYEPAHANYRPYYELAARYKVPVVFHTGDTYSAMAKLKYAHPLGVDEVAVDHPNVNFVLAHVSNPWMRDAAEVVYKNLNVWADLSGLVVGDGSQFHDDDYMDALSDLADDLRRAFRYADRPNRFLFGTDWPLIPCKPYREFIAGIVPEHCHEQVFAENARRLFRIP